MRVMEYYIFYEFIKHNTQKRNSMYYNIVDRFLCEYREYVFPYK